jgi:hypothetical protein
MQEHGTSAKDNLQQMNQPAPLRQTALSPPGLYSDLGKTVYTGGANPSDHAIRNRPACELHHERPPGLETSTPGVAIAGQGSLRCSRNARSPPLVRNRLGWGLLDQLRGPLVSRNWADHVAYYRARRYLGVIFVAWVVSLFWQSQGGAIFHPESWMIARNAKAIEKCLASVRFPS